MNERMRGRALYVAGRLIRIERMTFKKTEKHPMLSSYVCNCDSYPLSSTTAVAT
jgi:hypothetical protein